MGTVYEWFGLHIATAQVSIVWTKFSNLIIESGTVVLIPINCRIIFDFAPFLRTAFVSSFPSFFSFFSIFNCCHSVSQLVLKA